MGIPDKMANALLIQLDIIIKIIIDSKEVGIYGLKDRELYYRKKDSVLWTFICTIEDSIDPNEIIDYLNGEYMRSEF